MVLRKIFLLVLFWNSYNQRLKQYMTLKWYSRYRICLINLATVTNLILNRRFLLHFLDISSHNLFIQEKSPYRTIKTEISIKSPTRRAIHATNHATFRVSSKKVMYLSVVVETVVVVTPGITMVTVVVSVRPPPSVAVIMMSFVVPALKVDKSDATYNPPSEFILKYVPPVEVWSMEYVISPIKKGYHWISSLTGFCNFFQTIVYY